VVEHKKNSIARRFEPQVFGPNVNPFKVLGNFFPNTYKLEIPKKI
jgi:hypothetical protein